MLLNKQTLQLKIYESKCSIRYLLIPVDFMFPLPHKKIFFFLQIKESLSVFLTYE